MFHHRREPLPDGKQRRGLHGRDGTASRSFGKSKNKRRMVNARPCVYVEMAVCRKRIIDQYHERKSITSFAPESEISSSESRSGKSFRCGRDPFRVDPHSSGMAADARCAGPFVRSRLRGRKREPTASAVMSTLPTGIGPCERRLRRNRRSDNSYGVSRSAYTVGLPLI